MARIESDGVHTKIFADDGSELQGVEEVTFHHRASDIPRMKLTIGHVDATQSSMEAEATFWCVHPGSGELKEVAAITFKDGTAFNATSPKS